MTTGGRNWRRSWCVLSDRDHRELLRSIDRELPRAIALYRELRRRGSESTLGYPSSSSSRSGSGGHSDRTGELAASLADGKLVDPVHDAFVRLERCLFEVDREIRASISHALLLPEITPPKIPVRDVCVDCGGSVMIVGDLVGSRCLTCRRTHRARIEGKRRRRISPGRAD